ncbi:hypothetical protein [Modestobacter sp. I12A-02662]|uniref:hypothetical protein n=1 Tax=Modestobacter sp. I12A-02662 TaxID=1730496 RepID=UPI0034E03534
MSAHGDFDQDGSRGVQYAIEISSASDRGAVQRLIDDVEADATIPKALRTGVPVESSGTRIATDQ